MHAASFGLFVDKHVLQAALVTDLTFLLVVCDGLADRLGISRQCSLIVDLDAKLRLRISAAIGGTIL